MKLEDWNQKVWPFPVEKKITQECIDLFNFPACALDEIGGRKIAEFILNLIATEDEVFILCGAGKKGQIGKIIARRIKSAGVSLVVIDCAKEFSLNSCEYANRIIIDAMLDGDFLDHRSNNLLIEINKFLHNAKRVIAIDVPSGINYNDFSLPKNYIKADFTVTFGGKKPCHVLSPARDACGEVVVFDVGFDKRAVEKVLSAQRFTISFTLPKKISKSNPWAKLSASAHKFDRGHVLVIGGSSGKLGAPILTSTAALKSGAGWASVALPCSELKLEKFPIDLTFEPFFSNEKLHIDNIKLFVETRKVTAIVIGPGTVNSPLNEEAIRYLESLSFKNILIIIDAAATHGILEVNNLRANPEFFILTPHPGEWLHLSQKKPLELPTYENLVFIFERLQRHGISVIYKSATPLIFSGVQDLLICQGGTNSLARAGSGDVFAGCLASFGIFQEMTMREKCTRASAVIADALSRASHIYGPNSILATDLISCIQV